jgi:hypothetical protein
VPDFLPKEPPAGQQPAEEAQGAQFLEDPGETISRLRATLPQIPVPGNEDFWELLQAVARIAEQKVRRGASRQAEQPLLFAGEPEAIFSSLVRKSGYAFLSRGRRAALALDEGIDYRNRFLGAMLARRTATSSAPLRRV